MGAVRQDFVADDTGIEVHLEHLAVTQFVIFHQLGFAGFRIHIHASELVHLEFLSVFAHTLLGKEDRTR